MSERWAHALTAAQELQDRERDQWVLWTLARLPFLSEEVLEQLAGVKRRSLHSIVLRLVSISVLDSIAPPLCPGHSPRLFYLTDLGIATLAVMHDVEPEPLARRLRINHAGLVRLIPKLPSLQDIHRLLGAIAGACSPPAWLINVECPWRRRWILPSSNTALSVELPAFAELSLGSRSFECLLIADSGNLSVRAYWRTLAGLVRIRALQDGDPPVLVVATDSGRRAAAWERAILEVAESRREAPLRTYIVRWNDLARDLEGLVDHASQGDRVSGGNHSRLIQELSRLQPHHDGRRLPRIVGSLPAAGMKAINKSEQLAQVALQLTPSDRELLDVIGRHPFLSRSQLAAIVDRRVRQVRQRSNRLDAMGLTRVLRPEEVRSPKKSSVK